MGWYWLVGWFDFVGIKGLLVMTHDAHDGGDEWQEDYRVVHDPKPIGMRLFDWDWQYKFTNGDEQNGGCCASEDEAWEEARQHHLEYKD